MKTDSRISRSWIVDPMLLAIRINQKKDFSPKNMRGLNTWLTSFYNFDWRDLISNWGAAVGWVNGWTDRLQRNICINYNILKKEYFTVYSCIFTNETEKTKRDNWDDPRYMIIYVSQLPAIRRYINSKNKKYTTINNLTIYLYSDHYYVKSSLSF